MREVWAPRARWIRDRAAEAERRAERRAEAERQRALEARLNRPCSGADMERWIHYWNDLRRRVSQPREVSWLVVPSIEPVKGKANPAAAIAMCTDPEWLINIAIRSGFTREEIRVATRPAVQRGVRVYAADILDRYHPDLGQALRDLPDDFPYSQVKAVWEERGSRLPWLNSAELDGRSYSLCAVCDEYTPSALDSVRSLAYRVDVDRSCRTPSLPRMNYFENEKRQSLIDVLAAFPDLAVRWNRQINKDLMAKAKAEAEEKTDG